MKLDKHRKIEVSNRVGMNDGVIDERVWWRICYVRLILITLVSFHAIEDFRLDRDCCELKLNKPSYSVLGCPIRIPVKCRAVQSSFDSIIHI